MGRRRLITTWVARALVASLVVTSLTLVPSKQAAAATGDPFRFIYDQSGRLVAAVTPTDSARYTYDAVGNMTAIARVAATTVSVLEFAPHSGAVGAAVTVYGTGFSATPSQNTVKFNGVTATVSSATTTQIVTSVPSGATTGTISVTAPGGTSTSSATFTVGNTAPTITGFTPAVADLNATVTITGTNFETTPTNDAVTLNTTFAAVTAATATSLSTTAPPASGSGPIVVRTPNGKATATGDLFIAPSGFTASQVGPTARVSGGGSQTLTFSVAGKIGLLLIDVGAGQHLGLTLTNGLSNGYTLTIRGPDGALYYGPQCCSPTFAEIGPVQYAGTYTAIFDPGSTGTGTVNASAYVAADATAQLTAGGPAVTLSNTVPGQNIAFTFSGTSNERVSLTFTASPAAHYMLTIKQPGGLTLYGTPENLVFTDVLVLPVAGTYSVLLDQEGTWTGSIAAQLYDVPADATAQLTAGGSAVTLSNTAPGQNIVFTFVGTLNERVSLTFSGSPAHYLLTIKKPDGSTFYGTYENVGFTDVLTLPVAGTYTALIDQETSWVGSNTAQLYDVPADATAQLTAGGPAVTLTNTVPGQNIVFTFSGTTNERVNLTFSASPAAHYLLTIRNPDNSILYATSENVTSTGTLTLLSDGTYTVLVDQETTWLGDITATLTDVIGLAPSDTVVASGEASSSSIASRATRGSFVFTGMSLAQAGDGTVSQVVDPATRPVAARSEEGDDSWVPDPANPRRWSTGRFNRPASSAGALLAPAGVTAISGLVLALNDQPLEGVRIAIDTESVTTTKDGRFLIAAAAGHHVLLLDGTAAVRGNASYGMFEIGIDVVDGRTNVLPFTIWLPRIDTAHAVSFPSPTTRETIITTPHIPGLELHLPAGSVVKDMAGKPVTEVSLTAIPIDRTPFPLPKFEEIPIYFTAQPGCAYVLPKGAQIWYPNYTDLPPGTRVNLWTYDPDKDGWHTYGHGTVTEDGKQVRPDADAFIYEFTGAMFSTIFNPAAWWAAVGDFFAGGDPVDLGSGLFVMDHTDLALPDVSPISLARTYRQADTNNRGWGAGWSHPYFVYLWSANQYQEVDLILPDGGRVHYVRTSPGTGWADAVFEHTASPSAFYKSHIYWNGTGWDVSLKDGTKLVFLDNGPLVAILDRYGNRTSLLRLGADPKGNIDVIRSPNGRWVQLKYQIAGQPNLISSATDNSGRSVTYDYDANNRLWKVHDAFGGITEYGYDASGRLRTIKDPKLITYLTVDYDANGRVQTQTQADNTTFQFAYTVVNGKVTQTDVTDPRTYIRRVTFNAAGYGVSDTAALGQSIAQTVSYERDPASNLVLSVTDPRSRVTRNTYYPSGDLWTTTSLYGTSDAVTTTFTYEPQFGQLASVTDPLTHATTFSYDASFNRISETDALQHATAFSYYPSGQLQTATNALQKTTSFVYDAGDMTTVTDPLGRVTKRFSDAIGRPITVTDPLGNRVRTDYDSLNRVTKVTDPKGNLTQFTYDANGNRLTVKDAKNNTTTYTYDNMDRLATRKDALLKTETYNSYDANGNLLVVTDRKSQVTEFRYDALDRQSFAGFGRTGTSPNFSYQSTINYTYDGGNRLTIAADSVAGNVTRGYDELDRLTSEVTAQGTLGYQYDTASRRTQLTVTGQTAVTYGYDNADRLASITQGTTVIGFGYDNADRRTSLTMPGNLAAAYGYDDASQLLSMTYTRSGLTIGDLAYTYDAAGRRATTSGGYARLNLPTAVTSATYNANNQLTKWGSTNLTYDLNGNMNGDGTNTYSWNSRDQLSAVTKSGQTLPSFTYDAFGRRQKKTLGAVVTSYLYDGANTVQELTGASPSANLLTGLGVDELFQRAEGATTRTFLADALGGVVALADSAGVVQTSYTYAPYGATTVTGTASNNTSQFTGRENDGDGLYFYRARYYHPVMSRFVSEDPMGFGAGDPNLYAYTAGSPTNFTDPSGQCVPAAIFGAALDIGAFVMSGRKSEKTFGDWVLLAGSIALDVACVGLIGKAIRAAGLVQRVSQLHHLLDDIKQAMTTTAALRAVASNGAARVIVASSDRYLPSVIKRALMAGEIAASGKGHAEITAIEKALELGLKPVQIAASRGICPACRQRIAELGIKALTPFRE